MRKQKTGMSGIERADKANEMRADWLKLLAQFERPSLPKAIWQLVTTFVPYLCLWVLMVRSVQLGYPYWLTLGLCVVAAGFLVRIFIFFHDCGHGSFFATRRANTILGYVSGILTFTPYHAWRHSHSVHHATAGDLDRRGTGDIKTMTVDEYLAAPRRQRFAYRLIRNPLLMLAVGPTLIFLIAYRFPPKGGQRRHKMSVHLTNLGLLAIGIAATFTIGLKTYLVIQLPTMIMAGAVGLWLFYVQHQFEGVYWARHEEWSPMRASLEGSSYYKLPKVLQWFTGNIGLHHIHHLRPRIPNYHLQRCYDTVAEVRAVPPLTLRKSLKSLRLNLWDEKRQQLVRFQSLRKFPAKGAAG